MCLLAILTSLLSGAAFIWTALRLGLVEKHSKLIAMKISQLQPALSGIETTLEQVRAEVTALIEATRDAELPADVNASLERIRVLVDHIESITPEMPVGTSVAQV